MKDKAKIIILAIIIILWMAFIFSMSAKNATQSSDISGGFTYNVLNTFFADFRGLDKSIQDNIVEGLQFVVRKGAHFSAYAVLGGLCFVECSYFNRFNLKNKFTAAFLISVLYAVSDEIHQYFVPGRACEFRDVVIDSCGVLFGITVVVVFNIIKNKFKKSIPR
ncbi:VanZ family protein [Intestinibacter sp.]|uniref:VanZ family protein n=1 Tax=Intestinibacter sp. TaxID=1965304 RepID=UPI002A75EB4D|nr:VanZ family protein [Intestinibacter sp.]MDY2736150.1 VanZ family protein [Intestinibacter sp.]